MRKVLVSSLGLVLLLSFVGCNKHHHEMEKSPSTMPAMK